MFIIISLTKIYPQYDYDGMNLQFQFMCVIEQDNKGNSKYL